jgi:replicative DNA helicase
MTALDNLDKYGNTFQTKVLGLLLTDKKFLVNVSDSLTDEYFENPSRKWIIKRLQKYFDEYNTTPTLEALSIEVKKEENDVLKIALTEELKQAYSLAEKSTDNEYIEKEFSEFCQNQQMKKAIMTSVDLLNDGDYESIRTLISKAIISTEEKNVGHDYEKDVESRYRPDDRRVIPTPWPEINAITQGGYGKGDLIIFFGGPGAGKSWATISMALEAVKLGGNVVYYSLELGDGYVGKRFDANLTKIPVDQLPMHRLKIEESVAGLSGKLIIKEFPPKRASLDDIERHLDQLHTQHNFKPDAVFIDYLDLLRNRRSRNERKDDLDDIYTDAKGLAKELGIPFITPSQVNRSGAADKVVEGDKAAGSYDKIMIGDIVISTSRLRKDKINNTSRWHIIKNRYGNDGITFTCDFDGSTGITRITGEYIEDDEEQDNTTKSQQKPKSDFNSDDKDYLREKFFELSKSS